MNGEEGGKNSQRIWGEGGGYPNYTWGAWGIVPSADSALKKWADPKNCALLLRRALLFPILSAPIESDHLHT